MLDWFSNFVPVGILVTDIDLSVATANGWFLRHFEQDGRKDVVGCHLFELVPDIVARGLDRYYQSALAGETRLLSHRFHKYLIPMRSTVPSSDFDCMQQSVVISPLRIGDELVGTVTMIEDVTERVVRERELNARIEESEQRLADELLARDIAEENARLKGHNELLSQEGRELQHLNQTREAYLHRMISSQEEERKRIARDIHDHLGQQLTGLRLSLMALKETLHRGDDPAYDFEKIDSIAGAIDRDLDFISAELRPSGLDDLGLEQSLRQFVEQWSRHFAVRAEFHSSGFHERTVPPDVSINLYRITQEALNNIVKHARARHVSVLLENRNGSVVLIIEDDGVGFDVDKNPTSIRVGHGAGLVGMKERSALIGGTIEIESIKNRGTTIYVRVDKPIQR